MRKKLGDFTRFLSVGAINTIIGLMLVWLLLYLKFIPVMANIIGYSVGIIIGYYLNSELTFNNTQGGWINFIRYIFSFLISLGLNLIILSVGISIFNFNAMIAQIPAMITYTFVHYLICKYYVFTQSAKDA